MVKITIALYQGRHGVGLPAEITACLKRHRPDILCLPEYFMVGPNDESILPSAGKHDQHLDYLKKLTLELGCAITGATLLKEVANGYKNVCYFMYDGGVAGFYEKIHPFKNEGQGKVLPGHDYKVIRYKNIRVGLLICADVLFAWSYANIRGLRPDLIIVPTTSPYQKRESVRRKFSRDRRYYLEGAKIARCPVVKVSSVGRIAKRRVQGRSLVATPEGIIFRVPPSDESKPVLQLIDLDI